MGKADDLSHMFVPNVRVGAWNAPRPRRPTRSEPWLNESGEEIGVQYVYDGNAITNNLKEALQFLAECEPYCISCATQFMDYIQKFCTENCSVPCMMSPLAVLPVEEKLIDKDGRIMLLTRDYAAFAAKYPTYVQDERYVLVGLQDTDAFGPEAVAGSVVDTVFAEEAIERTVERAIAAEPKRVVAIIFECTEVPQHANYLRKMFDLPVYDVIATCNLTFSAKMPRNDYDSATLYG